MPEAIQTYTIQSSGFGRRHRVSDQDGERGVLTLDRRFGRIHQAQYHPSKKGEVLTFRPEPGMLPNQYSVWNEHREWLGSSLRWNMFKREILVNTGSRPYRVIPLPSLTRGWRLCAPKTGEMCRFDAGLVGGKTRIEVYRRMDFDLLLFAYFVGTRNLLLSIWPGPTLDADNEAVPSPSGA